MILVGQTERFASETTTECTKSNSVDVSRLDKNQTGRGLTDELVTAVDKAVETMIYRTISKAYPDHALQVAGRPRRTATLMRLA